MKNKFYFLILMMGLFATRIEAQDLNLNWVKGLGGTSGDAALSTAVDGAGNVYTTGYFNDTVDFDPNAGVANLISAGGNDMFISKLDANGNYVWAKAIGGANFEKGESIAVDVTGNIYITGNFDGTVDFDPNAGTTNLNSTNGSVFIIKLNTNGNLVWAKNLGGFGSNGGGITIDITNNVYITGNFANTADFDPDAGIANLVGVGLGNIFICKLDNNGSYVWAKAMSGGTGGGERFGRSIKVDALGGIYTVGTFEGIVDFDPSGSIVNLTSNGDIDIFISKLDAGGNYVWAKAIGGTGFDYGVSIALDAGGNVYTTGWFLGTVDFDPNAGVVNLMSSMGGAFISKLDTNGNYVWAKNIGGLRSFSVAIDASNNVYTTGYFSGIADFDPNVGIINLVGGNSVANLFVSKLDVNGNYMLAKNIGNAVGMSVQGSSIALDASNNVYVAGYFQSLSAGSTIDFNPNDCVTNLAGTFSNDIFVAKYTQCTTTTITNTSLTNGIIGGTYSQTLAQTGLTGTPMWSVCIGSLPAGLSLSPTTGIISGTPNATGTSNFIISVSNGTCSGAKALSIVVACPTIVITPTFIATQNYVVGTTVNITLGASGAGSATYTYAVTNGSLPVGTALAGGVISGTPTTVTAPSTFTITATSSIGACIGTSVYNYSVACPVITFTNTTAIAAVVNTPYTLNVSASNATSYSVSPALPAGLVLNTASGVISGTPAAAVTSTPYIITATQGVCSNIQTYTFAVTNCVLFALSPTTNFLPSGNVGVPYVGVTIAPVTTVTGATYKYFKRNAINWQTGLTLNEDTGTISGTPSFSTSINVVIEAVNQTTGCGSILTSYTLVIYPDPATAIDSSLGGIKIYPNPSSDDFNIDFASLNLGKVAIGVYDIQGKQVFTTSTSDNTTVISLEKFAKGMYLMEIDSQKGRILKRIVKE